MNKFDTIIYGLCWFYVVLERRCMFVSLSIQMYNIIGLNWPGVCIMSFLTFTQEENKEIALGTSKLNYLDPRISVAWCKKWDVPIEKIYNKSQRQKFAWAIDMADEDFVF